MYESRVLGFLMLAVKNSKKRLVAFLPSCVMMAGSVGALSGVMMVRAWLMIRAAPAQAVDIDFYSALTEI
jgi:hypothetical protein